MITIARHGIWDLTLAINTLLPEARCHARHEADQLVADCYRGRPRTFLNPRGRQPGSRSSVVIEDSQADTEYMF